MGRGEVGLHAQERGESLGFSSGNKPATASLEASVLGCARQSG